MFQLASDLNMLFFIHWSEWKGKKNLSLFFLFGGHFYRVPEQAELKHVCSDRHELRTTINIRNWCAQSNGETCKGDDKSAHREAGRW